MKTKKYTYSDWLNGKVVLIYSRREFNRKEVSEPILVSWENFNEKEKAKILKKQENLFDQIFKEQFEKTTKDFKVKFESSMFPDIFIDREFKSLSALWNNRYQCNGGICYSPIPFDNRTFDDLYYQEMLIHKTDCFINGVRGKYDSVPSPNSIYHNKNFVLPEIMITTVLQMLRFIKEIKSKRKQLVSLSDHKNEAIFVISEEEIAEKNKKENFLEQGFDARFFDGANAYSLFLECKSAIQVRNAGKQKKEDSLPSEVAKYSIIFNFLKEKSIIHPDVKHLPFIKYLKKEHKANIPDSCKKFPYQPSINDLNTLKAIHKNWKNK